MGRVLNISSLDKAVACVAVNIVVGYVEKVHDGMRYTIPRCRTGIAPSALPLPSRPR